MVTSGLKGQRYQHVSALLVLYTKPKALFLDLFQCFLFVLYIVFRVLNVVFLMTYVVLTSAFCEGAQCSYNSMEEGGKGWESHEKFSKSSY